MLVQILDLVLLKASASTVVVFRDVRNVVRDVRVVCHASMAVVVDV